MSNLKKDIKIYTAIRQRPDRSKMEDLLVLDGFDVSSFPTPQELWEHMKTRPARFVITDRRFDGDFSGLDLVANIRKTYRLPYIYVVLRSTMGRLEEIKEGLAAGADDYLLRSNNQFQIRSRVLVGLRWLAYMDSLNLAADKNAPAPT
jgi:PleD family two-component response regulator